MKNILTISLVFFLTFSYSQDESIPVPSNPPLQVGIYAGINFSSFLFENENVSPEAIKLGPQFGVQLNYWINDNWFIDTEIGFDRKGSGSEMIEEEIKLGYLGIKFNLSYTKKQLVGQLGFYYAWLMGEESNYDSSQTLEYFKNRDYGINFGAGVPPAPKLMILLNLQVGLNNIVEEPEDPRISSLFFPSNGESTRNRVIQVTLRYSFTDR